MGVERVRRAHLNDMENILPFFCLGILYIFTNPALSTAVLVFRIFAACRITHSIVYLLVIPQVILCLLAKLKLSDSICHQIISSSFMIITQSITHFVIDSQDEFSIFFCPARALAFFGGMGCNSLFYRYRF